METAAAWHVRMCFDLLHEVLNADNLLLATTVDSDSFHLTVAVGSGFESAHPAQLLCTSWVGPTQLSSDCYFAWDS